MHYDFLCVFCPCVLIVFVVCVYVLISFIGDFVLWFGKKNVIGSAVNQGLDFLSDLIWSDLMCVCVWLTGECVLLSEDTCRISAVDRAVWWGGSAGVVNQAAVMSGHGFFITPGSHPTTLSACQRAHTYARKYTQTKTYWPKQSWHQKRNGRNQSFCSCIILAI